MSSNYSAGQYNNSFSPKRLGNWEVAKNDCRPVYVPKGRPTEFIANGRGHLLPHIPRQKLSAWGCLYNRCVNKCICAKRSRFVQTHSKMSTTADCNTRFPIPSYYKTPKNANASVPKDRDCHGLPRQIIDPFLRYLRKLQLPTIWVIGNPTESIKHKRKQIVKHLARELSYCYIDLETQVGSWVDRHLESSPTSNTSLQSQPEEQEQRQQEQDIENNNLQEKPLTKPQVIPTYRTQREQEQAQAEVSKCNFRQPNSSYSSKTRFGIITEENNICDFAINFDTTEPFDTEQILDLIKFAMIEALPCKGYVIDAFPCNLDEAVKFEKHFYRAALGLHFVPLSKAPSTPPPPPKNSTTTHENIFGGSVNSKKPVNQLQQHQQLNKNEDPLVFHRRFTKKLQYSAGAKVENQICDKYGSKIIRVLDTNNVDQDALDCIYDIICDNLERYREIANGGRVDWKIDSDTDVD